MQENVELVQRGFRVLVAAMSGYIGQEMRKEYKDQWWEQVLILLSDQYDLPRDGSYGDLVDSLDIANCLRLIDRNWKYLFYKLLPKDCRTWSTELMGVRNDVSHLGQKDLDQPKAERALDTMALLCKHIDRDSEAEIREIYQLVRTRAGGDVASYVGAAQPESASSRGALARGSLLQLEGTGLVEKTTLSRKVTFGGKTEAYPVYRVSLDALFYNDQNDRIATWISHYEAENGKNALGALSKEDFNNAIEEFIYNSNPEAIVKTQKNIALVGQREPGVTLADGRVVDGNRRFTCLRRLQRGTGIPLFFETVIMDVDIHADRKQIKLLELSIQHGEEKKVDYDLIDYAIGTYRDIIQTNLLTAKEYAASTNESVAEVTKRIEIAQIIHEFLEYIKLPGQYHVARDYQVYSIFSEMMPLIKRLSWEEQEQLKKIVYNNTMLHAVPDQRKFIRDIKLLIKNEVYTDYFEDQKKWGALLTEKFAPLNVTTKPDIDAFAAQNRDLAEELQLSLERALLRARSSILKSKPCENVEKCIGLLSEVDPRLFYKMDNEDKEQLRSGLDELERIAANFKTML